MTEHEFMNLGAQAIESAGVVTATSFTLVFGYLAGLYFFVSRAPWFVKVVAFGFFTVCLVWMWAGLMGVLWLVTGLFQRAEVSISEGHTYVALTDAQLVFWLNFNDMASVGLNFVMGFTWLALFYATFFYKWHKDEQPAG